MAFENMFYDERNVIPVLLAGKIKHFDAVTVKKDTIDGITAPWYRVNFVDEVASMDYWIFGGYVKEIEDPFTKEYEKLLCESAVQKGLLIPVAKIKEENKKLQTQALNVYDVGDLLRPNRDFIEKNATSTEEVPHYYTKYSNISLDKISYLLVKFPCIHEVIDLTYFCKSLLIMDLQKYVIFLF